MNSIPGGDHDTNTLDSWCGHADATEIGIFVQPNTFVVHTYPTGSCSPAVVAGIDNQILTLVHTSMNRAGSSFIGAGDTNLITGNGVLAAIPAGDHLIAQAYSQTILGFNNVPEGTAVDAKSALANGDNFLVIVGNGASSASTSRSDAFEISNNGHSIVHDINGTGILPGGRPYINGARYADNTLASWGYCTVPVGGPVAVVSDFGVAFVAYNGPGNYTVHLNTTTPLTTGSVVATIDAAATDCLIISVSPIAGGIFNIYIHDPTNSCTPVDHSFMFQVVGR